MAKAEAAPRRASRALLGSEPLLWLWRVMASAQFALALIGFIAVAGLLAVVVPQIPAAMRDSPVAVDAWLEPQRDNYGPFTDAMHRAGVFSVVTAWWFVTALGLLAVSVCVYMVDRFLSVWRNVTSPRELVPDGFFDRAANRVSLATPQAAAGETASSRLEALLRGRRFSVRRVVQGDTTFLFADRFAWAQLGTFASHLALIMFLAGALVSQTRGYTNGVLIAEGTSSPVFPVSHPDQMQVEVVDAVGVFDDQGAPRDYRSELVIYQGGNEVARGTTTVNSPMTYGGYRFHQTGYFGEGAALRVRDVTTGNTLYREVLALTELMPAPAIVVRDARGAVLLDDVIVPTDLIEETNGTLITVPGTGRDFWVGVAQDEDFTWSLVVYERDDAGARFVLAEGESRAAAGLDWTFAQTTGLPSIVAPGLPGDRESSLTVLSETPEGSPYLTVLGAVDGRALTLYPDLPVQIGDTEYVFEGRREFSGIEVRRDPGAMFIWVAAGLLLAGLLVTFYLPRLRLWARVRPEETVVAGLAERRGVFQTEAKYLTRALGAVEEGEGMDEGESDA